MIFLFDISSDISKRNIQREIYKEKYTRRNIQREIYKEKYTKKYKE